MTRPINALTVTTEVCKRIVHCGIALIIGLTLAVPLRADKVSNQDCLDCHTDPTTSRNVQGKLVPMSVFPTNSFLKSVHAKLDCTDCHNTITEMVHPSNLPPPQCASCHKDQAEQYAGSIHGMSKAMGASGAATCVDCHGSHDMQPVKHSDSPVFKLNLPRTCAKCHSNAGITGEYRMKYPQVATQYAESIHGRALLQMGLILAPSCNDCHGVHNIKRTVDRSSTVNHANIATTCGQCHLGIEKTFNESVHGKVLAKGDKTGPVCTDCHSAHEIDSPTGANFKARSDERCGRCHQDRLEHYRDTYHGKAMALAGPMSPPKWPPVTTATATTMSNQTRTQARTFARPT